MNYGKTIIKVILSVILILGIFFRVVNLEEKPYWDMDEAFTLIRASGYTVGEVDQTLSPGKIVSVSEFQEYLQPSTETSAMGTIRALVTETPQHPPLYFLLTRFWQQQFGTSKATLRTLPVLFSLLTFPAIYWLCWELFGLPLVGWLAMDFYGVSPIMLVYSQFLRPYSLLLLLTLLSSAILLRLLRYPTRLGWSLYTITMIMGFYTQLLTGLVAIAHGIYVLLREQCRPTAILKQFLFSAIAITIIISPWLALLWQNRQTSQQTLEWATNASPLIKLASQWISNLNQGFVAWHFQDEAVLAYTIIPLVALLVYSFYFLCRRASLRVWSFILILLGISFLPFVIADLSLGGVRSINARYFVICYVGMDIVIAYCLVSHSLPKSPQLSYSRLWSLGTVFLLMASTIGSGVGALGETWWGVSEYEKPLVEMISNSDRPLFLKECLMNFCASIHGKVYYPMILDSETHLLFIEDAASFSFPEEFATLYIYNPSDNFLSALDGQTLPYELAYRFQDSTTGFGFSIYRITINKKIN